MMNFRVNLFVAERAEEEMSQRRRVRADVVVATPIFWTRALKKAFRIPAGCARWSLEGSPQSLYYRSQMCPLKYI